MVRRWRSQLLHRVQRIGRHRRRAKASGQAIAGGTIITPLETLLTTQLVLQLADGPGRRYPLTFCAAGGCVSRVGFTQADIDAMKRGANATITIVPAGNPNQPVPLTVSLTGFTAAFDALTPR